MEKQYLERQSACKAGIKRLWDEYNKQDKEDEEMEEEEERTVYPKGVVAFVSNLDLKSSKMAIRVTKCSPQVRASNSHCHRNC